MRGYLFLEKNWKWKLLSHVRLFAIPWNSPGQNTGVGSLFLLQGIFPTQGLSLGLPHCQQILHQLSHKGIPWERCQLIHVEGIMEIEKSLLGYHHILDWFRQKLFVSDGTESPCNVGDPSLIPGSGRCIPWRRAWLPTPVFLPGELRGQRSLAGYSPWGRKELVTSD